MLENAVGSKSIIVDCMIKDHVDLGIVRGSRGSYFSSSGAILTSETTFPEEICRSRARL